MSFSKHSDIIVSDSVSVIHSRSVCDQVIYHSHVMVMFGFSEEEVCTVTVLSTQACGRTFLQK